MMRWSAALKVWHEGRVREQRGFALLFVLAVIGFTSLVFVALIGLLLVSVRVTDQQARNTREQLALDGAIEAAANQLRYLPGAVFSDPCDVEVPFERVEQMTFDDGHGGGGSRGRRGVQRWRGRGFELCGGRGTARRRQRVRRHSRSAVAVDDGLQLARLDR